MQPRLFIPKGAQLKEREPLNHVPVPHPRYQPRLMSSPLMKKKKKHEVPAPPGGEREGQEWGGRVRVCVTEGLIVNVPQVQ